ncbi:MAG TPA: hypothetical protein ENJ95_10490 [Bacteroidetes bacterium]|nr:hypothetical protein [Bacteroidota bacterium]
MIKKKPFEQLLKGLFLLRRPALLARIPNARLPEILLENGAIERANPKFSFQKKPFAAMSMLGRLILVGLRDPCSTPSSIRAIFVVLQAALGFTQPLLLGGAFKFPSRSLF